VAKFHDAKGASNYHKAVKKLGYEAHVLTCSAKVVDAANALHEHVYGSGALAGVEEGAKSAAALVSMLRVFAPKGGSTLREAEPFKAVIAKVRKLHESTQSFDQLVDDVAVELADLSAQPDLVEKAASLQQVARYILLGEGVVPAPLRVSFEALVSHIKRMAAERSAQ
jgi:hypothetical protein